MGEENLVAGAEIIQVISSVRVFQEAVLRALAIAGEAHAAFKTLPRKSVQFVPSKRDLL